MPMRKMLLWAMLWSLALTAAIGVLAALLDARDLIVRVIATGVSSAVACAILIPISLWVDREKTRPGGLAGMTAVTIEFVLAQVLIWEVPRHLLGESWEEELALTMVILAFAAIGWTGLLRLHYVTAAAIMARVGLYAVSATFVIFMLATWVGEPFSGNDDLWLTGWAVFIFGGLAAICLLAPGERRPRAWQYAVLPACIGAWALWMGNVWFDLESDAAGVAFSVLTSVAAALDIALLCLMARLPAGAHWVRQGTILMAALTGALIDLIVVDELLFDIPGDFNLLSRFATATGIVAGSGAMGVIVLARMHRRVELATHLPELSRITVICPRCRRRQQIGLGESACPACNLRISIQIEEPSCAKCGYLLHGLTSDRCPECGTVIAGPDVRVAKSRV